VSVKFKWLTNYGGRKAGDLEENDEANYEIWWAAGLVRRVDGPDPSIAQRVIDHPPVDRAMRRKDARKK